MEILNRVRKHPRIAISFLCLTLVAPFGLHGASAEETTYKAVQDTWIEQAQPYANFSADTRLHVGYSPTQAASYAAVRIPNPPVGEYASVKVRLYVDSAADVNLFYTSIDNLDTVTWSTFKSPLGNPIGSASSATAGYVEIPMNAALWKYQGGGYQTFLVSARSMEPMSLFSIEGGKPAEIITTSGAAVTSTTKAAPPVTTTQVVPTTATTPATVAPVSNVVVIPEGDTHVSQRFPTQNFASADRLMVGGTNGDYYRTYVSFKINPAQYSTARLSFWLGCERESGTVQVVPNADLASLTWANQPAASNVIGSYDGATATSNCTTDDNPRRFTIPLDLKTVSNGGLQTFVVSHNRDSAVSNFRSKEAFWSPVLLLSTGGSPTPSTTVPQVTTTTKAASPVTTATTAAPAPSCRGNKKKCH